MFEGLTNITPFAAEQLLLLDEKGRDLLVLIVKATYRIASNSEIVLADEQVPVNMEGEHWGEPGESSYRYEPEVAMLKMATDVALIGHAYPEGKEATQTDVGLRVGGVQKMVRVFGERRWTKKFGFERITPPKPFEPIPLIYERAFGGWDRTDDDPQKHTYEPRNPVGLGFRHKKFGSFEEDRELPNLEDPASPIKDSKDAPPPAGFGFIGPHWQPRAQYVGTYDEAWSKTKMPLLPDDFDRRYFNAAHPDLIAPGYLQGNEPVVIHNASKRGRIQFQLPGVPPPVATVTFADGKTKQITTNPDTVIINTDDDLVLLLWRGMLDIHGQLHSIRSVKVEATIPGTSTSLR